jgi:tetratricopeptide (TPR) repeat protein
MGMPLLPSSVLARRSCFERWEAYTPGLDDWELWLRWAARGCRFACIEQPLLYYRIHDQNFNLDWWRRWEAHFRMLDTFFAMENLPDTARRLRERAYANQHFGFAVLAEQVGRPEDGVVEFREAVSLNPDYLTDLDFYTRYACGHQGRIHAGTVRNLDLSVAESTLLRALGGLFGSSEIPETLADRSALAYGWAYLALARLAYGVTHQMRRTRRYLWRAWRYYPALLWRTDWSIWLLRATVGHRMIQLVKRASSLEVRRAHR